MSDLVREALRRVRTEHGVDAEEPRRCEVLLEAECPQYPTQIQYLVAALEAGIIRQLMSQKQESWQMRIDRIKRELVRVMGWDEEVALWVVETWRLALHQGPEPPAPFVPVFVGGRPRAELDPDSRKEGGIAGLSAGGVIGMLLSVCCVILASVHENFDIIGWGLLLWPIAGLAVGAWLGALVGPRVQDNRSILCGSLAGFVCGVGAGFVFAFLLYPAVTPVPLELRFTAIVILGAGVIGTFKGTMIGMGLQYPNRRQAMEVDEDEDWRMRTL